MVKSSYKVIGVMSGTSLDGIDLTYINFIYKKKQWYFEIIQSETISYSHEWHHMLNNLITFSKDELLQIDIKYTEYLAAIIKGFIKKNKIIYIDAVCSHGHTAWHKPDKGITYQIGNLKELAPLLNHKVVCDFRTQDVKLGGQGAPLVPIGDALLFSEYDYCLNLGGFANISTIINENRIAYDICPVNIILNHYASKIGLEYDDNGKLAASGTTNKDLLNRLNALSFYKQPYPKSLGYEWVKLHVIPLIDSFQIALKDILNTFVMHIAFQISNEINKKSNANVLVTGGGVYNNFLISELKNISENMLVVPNKNLIEYKEALIFGFLGVLKMRNETNCLASVTGANRDHSSGKIYLP